MLFLRVTEAKGLGAMNRGVKLLLGLFTVYPFFYVLWAFMQLPSMIQGGLETDLFYRLFGLHVFALLLTFVSLVLYLVHLYRNTQVHGNQKMIWTIALLMGGFVTMPIYWWIYIWPMKERVKKPKTIRN